MSCLVSILIPAFNSEKFIAQTIKSALSQTWEKKEIIIVNDGSTDNTLNIANSFQSRSVKVISQENKGSCEARNAAFSIAQGDYIQWLDADDLLAPDKIAMQMNYAEGAAESHVLLSGQFGQFYYRTNKAVFIPTCTWKDLYPIEWLVNKYSHKAYIAIHAWLTSRRLIDLAGKWDSQLSKTDDDGVYYSRVVSASAYVKFVAESKCYYRAGIKNSISASRSDLPSEALSKKMYIQTLLGLENTPRTRLACQKLLQRWINDDRAYDPELFKAAGEIAEEFSLVITPPDIPRRTRVARKIIGIVYAEKVRVAKLNMNIKLRSGWDKMIYRLLTKNE